MRNLFILALLLSVSCGDTLFAKSIPCFKMTFSDALPVQFWANGCETFNEKNVPGIHQACFCQPFQCDDNIIIQFLDSTIGPPQSVSLPSLSAWMTRGVDPSLIDWTTGASPSVDLNGQTSEILYADYAFIPLREYAITINYTRTVHSGSSNPRTTTLYVLDSSYNTIFSQSFTASSGANTNTFTFTATSACVKFGVSHTSGSNVTIAITSQSATISTNIDYDLSIVDDTDTQIDLQSFSATAISTGQFLFKAQFSPLDYDICDQQIRLKILKHGGTQVMAYSDCINLLSDATETVLITYSNHRNFAGIDYSDVTPDPEYQLRIPGIFFHERNPNEEEVIELSSNREIQINSQIKVQRFLDTGHMPDYMHRKVLLALMHQLVVIDGLSWIKSDTYDKVDGNKHYPLRRAQTWLTQEDYIVRNIL